jgi:hypothetical protein
MRLNLHSVVAAAVTIAVGAFATQSALAAAPHNVLLFVADGLRPGMVNSQNAPTRQCNTLSVNSFEACHFD